MMRAILIDDEPQSLELLQGFLQAEEAKTEVIGVARSPKQGLRMIQSKEPDLVFLDINMPGLNGFELLERCAPRNFETVIVSAHERFALEAYRHQALHYILKPFSQKEVVDSVKRVSGLLQQQGPKPESQGTGAPRISVNTLEGMHILTISDVLRCEADGSYTYVYLRSGWHVLASHSIKFFDKQLSPHGFMRVHKSHLVNLGEVAFLDHDGGIFLKQESPRIQVALRRRKELMRHLVGG